MTDLKLLALDNEDLEVISAYTQDAVMRVGDIGFAKTESRFACIMNRYVWEEGDTKTKGRRRRAAIHFDHVTDISSGKINLDAKEGVLDLLSIDFEMTEAPAGKVVLTFAGGGSIHLTVECLEAQMSDLGAVWAAKAQPSHDLDRN